MAEIKIEKKSPIWPWILLAVVIVGVLIYVFASDRDDDNHRNNRDGNRENTHQPMNERNRENTPQPMNSLPDTTNSEVILLSIIKDYLYQVGIG